MIPNWNCFQGKINVNVNIPINYFFTFLNSTFNKGLELQNDQFHLLVVVLKTKSNWIKNNEDRML